MARTREVRALPVTAVVMFVVALGSFALAPSSGAQTPALSAALVCPGDTPIGGYGVTVTNGTGADIDFTLTITDPLDGTVGTDDTGNSVDGGGTVTLTFGDGPSGTIGSETVTLEDAVLTVTDQAAPANTATITLNCNAAAIAGIAATAVCVAGPQNTLTIVNSRTDGVAVTLTGIPAQGAEVGLGTIAVPAGGTTNTQVLAQFRTVRVVVAGEPDAGAILVSFADCPLSGVTTTTGSTTTTVAGGAGATTTTRSGTALANTGKGDGALAGLGTTIAIIGLVLLATSKWWIGLIWQRETLVADFNRWRLRDR